jgi:serine protease Do
MTGLAAALDAQNRLAELAERIRQSTVQLQAGPHQLGAGIAWGEDLVITNAHVAVADSLEVTRPDWQRRQGRLVARDPKRDLALLEVPRLDLAPVSLGGSARLRPGMLVFAIGHPFGLVGALATGIVHAVGPAPAQWIPNAVAGRLPWLLLDMEVAPGNSGGPVLDAHGEVVGITTMIAFGLALAVPGEAAFRWASHQLQQCRSKRSA